jgi:hypothetical protein
MQLHIGTLLDVTTFEGTWPSGDKRIEHTAHVMDGLRVDQIALATPTPQRPGLNPDDVRQFKGQHIALETYGRGGGNKRVYLTATRVLSESDIAGALGITSSAKAS